MAKNNKSYRIRTKIGQEADSFLDIHLDQDYDSLEILSLKISDKDAYKLHNSDYGVVVGRVLANGNFGVPNAKISVFIEADEQNSDMKMWNLYPYTSTSTKNEDDIRYNLLPDESVKDCHKAIGTFPNKTYMLENDAILEVFDKYYIYTTRTNAAGDYLICGVPTGMQTLHMDLDLSDCGILSQRPRDFVYKGYTIEQFENPNQFKKDENLDSLAQVFSQNQPVYVKPFWGNEDNGDEIGITRADIEISFKFEPTCVFMGSAISDNASNGVGKKCVPTNQMGAMDELTAGEGTIEMIRKTPAGNVEEFSIKGNQLINGNGVWCYQIPMNLDYMMTDEYGHMVPTDDPEKGIPTRTRVRFRASLTDMENSSQSYYRAKYLIPNNPAIDRNEVDYDFGTYTDEDSYRDLFWNGVYTVKSYIPRFQKSKRWKNERFSGIKACNYYGGNNPMPYNNLRIKLPFMFTVLCIFVKLFIKIVTIVNRFQVIFLKMIGLVIWGRAKRVRQWGMHCTYIGDGLCPDMEGWYFAPACAEGIGSSDLKSALIEMTFAAAMGGGDSPGVKDKSAINSGQYTDETSTDVQNTTRSEEDTVCLTRDVDYLVNCFEMNLAQEYRVIKFDFYNDWVNGVLYFPRWMRKIKRKKRYKFSLSNGITTYYKDKVQGCMNSDNSRVKKSRYYTQQCSLAYTGATNQPWTRITTAIACNETNKNKSKRKQSVPIFPARCHKKKGMEQSSIFGKKSGLVTERTTMLGQYVYYLKPCEWKDNENGKMRTLLFATDIVLLGTLNDCDENGIPQAFKYLNNTSYIMPTNLALTTMDDDSYIYSEAGGTICLSSNSTQTIGFNITEKNLKDSVRRITPSFETTSAAYKRTEDDKLEYIENDDPIPITEAAGITWNYSGPGQDDVLAGKKETPDNFINRLFADGNKRYKYIYYPGGHFLGLSCVNSETNIKSCVNLKRICELGATMSQRREEIRGYTSKGDPKYRYYVPTGLISNVDIEGASFRSMFATLNHNTLLATKPDEVTGYKTYDFRFLRPDGFDGGLAEYVHIKADSPYNRKVNDGTNISAPDETSRFLRLFPNWSKPDDYDEEESAYTETRTIEDTVNDYYMFRFGLDNFTDKEQKKHYLGKTTKGYILPQYENSFYFYFGLKDGSTALDEFKKQFFSECESNNVMKAPTLTVLEKISDDLSGTATLVIDNMLAAYEIKIRDNSIPENETAGPDNPANPSSTTINSDTYDLSQLIPIVIGHTYTVTVTDSLDQTAEKTFTFGASAVKVDIEAVHFRYDRGSVGSTKQDPKSGGFLKIHDTVKILGKEFHIKNPADNLTFTYKATGDHGFSTLSEYRMYKDASNEEWHIYFMKNLGTYDIHVNYQGKNIAIFTITMEDNKDVELYVGCDYFGYKTGKSLKDIPEGQWMNSTNLFKPESVSKLDGWLFRHTYYRQTEDDGAGYDSHVYTTKKGAEIAVFGQPEKGGLTKATTPDDQGGVVMNAIHFKPDYESYEGFAIDESWSFIPTMYWDTQHQEMGPVVGRNPFDVMVYTDDGRAAADAPTNVKITNIATDGNNLLLTGTGQVNGLAQDHGCIVVFENGLAVFPIITGSGLQMIAYNTTNPYEGVTDSAQLSELLSMAVVYPTLRVPVIYKPFYGEVSAATWSLTGLTVEVGENGPEVKRVQLPTSYKVEGDIHNGLTYDPNGNNGRFYSGETTTSDDEDGQIYDTFLIFNNKPDFYNSLRTPLDQDYKYDRKLHFGEGVSDGTGFYREITKYNVEDEDFEEIAYSITEGYPENASPDSIYTGRYENGFDLERLEDSCSLSSVFYNNLRLFAFSEDGVAGNCCLCADNVPNPETTKLYGVRYSADLFKDEGIITTKDEENTDTYGYGYYNKNAEFDVNGAPVRVIVRKAFGAIASLSFGKTQENGTKIRKTVYPDLGSSAEEKAFREGVTMLHWFTMKGDFKDNMFKLVQLEPPVSKIEKFITDNCSPITATTLVNGTPKSNGYSVFNITGNGSPKYTNVIAKYTRPDNTTNRNKMVVYKMYPLRALEVIYPLEAGGMKPFISPTAEITCTYEEQMISIHVTTNLHFKISTSSNWISIDNPNRLYGPETTSVNVKILSNAGLSSTQREGYVVFTPQEEGVSGQEAAEATGQTKIIQLKDDVAPVEQTANDALTSADNANQRIDGVDNEITDINGQIDDLWNAISNQNSGGDGGE